MPGPLLDKSFHVVGAAIVAIVVPTIAVALRCCSRELAKAGFWWHNLACSELSSPPCSLGILTFGTAFHLGASRPDAGLGLRRFRQAHLVTRCQTHRRLQDPAGIRVRLRYKYHPHPDVGYTLLLSNLRQESHVQDLSLDHRWNSRGMVDRYRCSGDIPMRPRCPTVGL